jgi:hypothetical protein
MDSNLVPAASQDTSLDTVDIETEEERKLKQEEFDKFWRELEEGEENSLSEAAEEDGAPDQIDPELEFEKRVERVRKTVLGNPRFVEINYRILEFCREQRILTEIEDMIATLPQFAACDQNQYRLISFLENAGGLERIELDEDLNPITKEMKEGLSEDEIDDLVCDYAFITTDAGEAVVEEMRPEKRIKELMEFFPQRAETYREVLDFCKEPRGWKEIDKLLEGRDVLKTGSLNTATNLPLKPTVFIDRLESSGGLVWDKGWRITPEGRRYLEAFQELNA